MKRLLEIVIISTLCLSIAACSKDSILAPRPFAMGDAPKGNAAFELGWDHGCETGMSTMTIASYKTFYTYRQDPNMIDNEDYYKAWKDAYTYCRQYAFKWVGWAWDQY